MGPTVVKIPHTGNHFLSEIYDFDHLNMADFLLDLGILDDLFGILGPFEDEEEESYDSDFSEEEKEDMRGRGPRKKRKKRDPNRSEIQVHHSKALTTHYNWVNCCFGIFILKEDNQ